MSNIIVSNLLFYNILLDEDVILVPDNSFGSNNAPSQSICDNYL